MMSKKHNSLLLGLAVLALISVACSCGLPSVLENLQATETSQPLPLPPTLPPPPTAAPTATLPPARPTPTPAVIVPTDTQVSKVYPTMNPGKEKVGAVVDAAFLEWPLLLSETFDQNSINWAEGSEEREIVTNEWKIEDGVYKWEIQAGQKGVYWMVWPDGAVAQDFYFSSMTHKVGGADNADVGLFFRMVDDNNFYVFLINRVFGNYAIQALIDGKWYTIVDWKYSDYIYMAKDPRNSISVGAQGDQFKFYINGRLVEQLEDDRLPAGKCGYVVDVYGSGDQALFFFDDFELRAP